MPEPVMFRRTSFDAFHPQPGQNGDLGEAPSFLLTSDDGTLVAEGVREVIASSDVETLPEVLHQHFATKHGEAAETMVVGVLPFLRDAAPYLFSPNRVQHLKQTPHLGYTAKPTAHATGRCAIQEEPTREVYEDMVRRALVQMQASDALTKIVLSRTLRLHAEHRIDLRMVLRRLAEDPEASAFAVQIPAERSGLNHATEPVTLVGATPELLLEKTGRQFRSLPLAGSAKRSNVPTDDREAAEQLLRSEKDRREHSAVVETMLERLAPFARNIQIDPEPILVSTATMWHLGTRLRGEVREQTVSSVDLAVALHPTAAVCGNPREQAAAAIRDLEPFGRGFFTGAVGWCNAAGDGRWMVTIRCGEIAGRDACLYAGAGIVAGSDPAAEAAETAAKFQTMLRALGIDEKGRIRDEAAA